MADQEFLSSSCRQEPSSPGAALDPVEDSSLTYNDGMIEPPSDPVTAAEEDPECPINNDTVISAETTLIKKVEGAATVAAAAARPTALLPRNDDGRILDAVPPLTSVATAAAAVCQKSPQHHHQLCLSRDSSSTGIDSLIMVSTFFDNQVFSKGFSIGSNSTTTMSNSDESMQIILPLPPFSTGATTTSRGATKFSALLERRQDMEQMLLVQPQMTTRSQSSVTMFTQPENGDPKPPPAAAAAPTALHHQTTKYVVVSPAAWAKSVKLHMQLLQHVVHCTTTTTCTSRTCAQMKALLQHPTQCSDSSAAAGAATAAATTHHCDECQRARSVLQLHARQCTDTTGHCPVPACELLKKKQQHHMLAQKMTQAAVHYQARPGAKSSAVLSHSSESGKMLLCTETASQITNAEPSTRKMSSSSSTVIDLADVQAHDVCLWNWADQHNVARNKVLLHQKGLTKGTQLYKVLVQSMAETHPTFTPSLLLLLRQQLGEDAQVLVSTSSSSHRCTTFRRATVVEVQHHAIHLFALYQQLLDKKKARSVDIVTGTDGADDVGGGGGNGRAKRSRPHHEGSDNDSSERAASSPVLGCNDGRLLSSSSPAASAATSPAAV